MRDKLADLCWNVAKRWRSVCAGLLILIISGVLSYTALLPREGFPSVQLPLTIVNVTGLGQSAEQMDQNIAVPLQEALGEDPSVDSVQTFSRKSFLNGVIVFSQETNPETGTDKVKSAIDDLNLDKSFNVEFSSVDPAKYLNEYDALVSVYAKNGQSIEENQSIAKEVAMELNKNEKVAEASAEPLIVRGNDPTTGEQSQQQRYFNSVGVKNNGEMEFYPSITVGVNKVKGADLIDISDALKDQLASLRGEERFDGYGLMIGADFADQLRTDLNGLQRNMISGIIAVVVVTILLISLRASFVTAIFIASVIFLSMLALLLVGYSLNVITLFALVLSLGLFVDDATIMVESIDSKRSGGKDLKQIIRSATKKVALASFAGTLTTVLVFAPLAFVGGLLGDFIRVLPLTVIIALFISYITSLILVPAIARFTILRSRKNSPISLVGAETALAGKLEASIKWLKHRKRLGRIWAISMIVLSLIFVVGAGYLSSKVSFNIFPPSKDSNQLRVSVGFAPGATINQAEDLASELNEVIKTSVGDEAQKVIYGGFDQATAQSADIVIELTPYDERDISSRDIAPKLESELNKVAGSKANIAVNQIDAGPPLMEFPFLVQVYGEDTDETIPKAREIASFLDEAKLTKQNGEEVEVTQTRISWTDSITRLEGKRAVQVEAAFDSNDVSAVVLAAQEAVEEEFDGRLGNVGFDFGQETENAESFSSLLFVFPIAVLLVITVLALQFRSFIQPILIFLAIPFSLLGIVLALYVTNNPLSFFSMLGVIGLIGIAVNNTIMLTDYANQQRRQGKDLVDSIAIASRERFRPLVVTTLTTTGALLPLAIYDPFWQSLAVVIIGGLISSTLLVVLAFPYYYYYLTKLGIVVGNKMPWKNKKTR